MGKNSLSTESISNAAVYNNIIKVDGLERKPFVKTGILPFASIKANTRKDENDFKTSFKFH